MLICSCALSILLPIDLRVNLVRLYWHRTKVQWLQILINSQVPEASLVFETKMVELGGYDYININLI